VQYRSRKKRLCGRHGLFHFFVLAKICTLTFLSKIPYRTLGTKSVPKPADGRRSWRSSTIATIVKLLAVAIAELFLRRKS